MRTAQRTAAAAVLSACWLVTGCGSDAPGTADASPTAAAALAGFTCPVAPDGAPPAEVGPANGGTLQIVTTVAPITSIVANVAGDRAEVHGVIPEGTNSHTYEPKPSVASLMADADVVFVNGLKLEDPTRELADENMHAGATLVELGTSTITPEQYVYDFSFPREAGKPNPHLWTNPPMASCYAAIVASTLAAADPANADYYRSNQARYAAKLDELDRLMVAATATVPAQDRKLLTYHDAYAYFAVHYGWTVVGAIQVSDFEDPTPREVTALIDQIEREEIPAIFGSEVFPSPVLEQIATETGARYVDELRDDDLPGAPGGAEHSYLGLMQFDFVTLVSSLGGDASGLQAFDPADVAADSADYPQ